MNKTVINKNPKTRELVIERVFRASPEILWRSWTEPELVEKWWGPKNWTAKMHEMDVRAGGIWRYSMAPDDGDGEIGRGKAIYKVVESPVRLEFVDTFADDNWRSIVGSEMDTTVTFQGKAGHTKLTITAVFASAEALKKAEAMGIGTGFSEALDRLEQHVTYKT